jgi:hypothetical protein
MPKELTLPGREEIRQLPRWARVALATRAVRRVASSFPLFFPDASSKQIQTIETALSLSESAAKECFESDHPLVEKMEEATQACEKLATTLIDPAPQAAWIALGAARAVEAARIACRGNRLLVVDSACKAIESAVEAVGTEAIQAGLHRDWQKLLKLIQKEEWTKDTPAPAKLFGAI